MAIAKSRQEAKRSDRDSTKYSKRRFLPLLEPLEDRLVLDGTTRSSVFDFYGAVTSVGQKVPFTLNLSSSLYAGDSDGKVRLILEVVPEGDSRIDPAKLTVSAYPRGKRPEIGAVQSNTFGQKYSSMAIKFRPGSYQLQVGADSGTLGAFAVHAYLLGDVNGNFQVTRQDTESVRSLLGSKNGDSRYLRSADVNFDGKISSLDVLWTRRNQQVRFLRPPITIEASLDKSSDPDGDRTFFGTSALIVGNTRPGARVTLDVGRDQSIEQETKADAQGKFQFSITTTSDTGVDLSVLATDQYAQRAEKLLTIRSSGELSASLEERASFLRSSTRDVTWGAGEGTHTIRFRLDSFFDQTDKTAAVEDLFQVYLVNTSTGVAMLEESGAPVLTLAGSRVESQAGRVRYNGQTVEIDVSNLAETTGRLVFQLVNSDSDEGTRVKIGQVAVDDSDLPSGGGIAQANAVPYGTIGGAQDLSSFRSTTGLQLVVTDVSVDRETGDYNADIKLKNIGVPERIRKVAVLFPGLPQGVQLETKSGDINTGSYINFSDALPAGGLGLNELSQPLRIHFKNPGLVRFALHPNFRIGPTNRAPVMPSIGAISAKPGERIELSIAASDPDGDRLSYSIRSKQQLPQGSLDADGKLVFTPSPTDIGTYHFTLVASDGDKEATRDVTLNVVSDSKKSTRISGRILATDGTPLAGVPISLGRLTVLTQTDGSFVLELPTEAMITEDFDIIIPQGEPLFDPFNTGAQYISFRRAIFDPATGTDINNPRQFVNQVSSFIDGSVVYGSTPNRAAALRMNDGSGRLKSSPGNLLPFNNTSYFPNGPIPNDNESINSPESLFVAGDVRTSENVQLAALHTLLMREHNRLADSYKAANPSWTDEHIYQAARRMVGAIIQNITYGEFIPALLGVDALPIYTGYKPTVDPRESGLFSTAAFRVGHTLFSPEVERLDASGVSLPGGPLTLREAFFNVAPISNDGIEPYLRGLVAQRAQEIDSQVIDAMRNFLFGPPGSGGMDLPALNIQRGRDMGLPDYNTARANFGLPRVTSFADITNNITLQNALQQTYGTVDNIDAWVGGICEDHVAGVAVGPLFRAIMIDQFTRSRDGDRFWFENSQFTSQELSAIRATTLSALIERNTTITGLPQNVLTHLSPNAGPAPAGMAANARPTDVRSFDGSGNNLQDPLLGKTGSHILANYDLAFGDGISTPAGIDRPNPRDISNAINAQTVQTPNSAGLTSMAVLWGQLLDHDLGLTPGGTTNTLKISANQLPGPIRYPFIAEKLPLVLDHQVFVGANNVIARPIYLPALDVAHGTQIDPTQDTLVTTSTLPNASVFVQAGTLQTRSGSPFNGILSITEVPTNLTPAALPPTLHPDVVVTIQPGEMVFTTPAPLTLPNRAGNAPGTIFDLWSINPITGFFDNVGSGEVSEDGMSIRTISGGIRNSSWHFFSPRPPELDNGGDRHPEDDCGCCRVGMPGTSMVDAHSGALSEEHSLVTYESLGVQRGITLHYDSMRADAQHVVPFGFDNTASNFPDLRIVAQLQYRRGYPWIQLPGFEGSVNGLRTGEHIWSIPEGQNRADASFLLDLSDSPSGVYDFRVWARVTRESTGYLGTDGLLLGKIISVNTKDSSFGSGWGIGGLEEIVENSDFSLLIVNGDGNQLHFMPKYPDSSDGGGLPGAGDGGSGGGSGGVAFVPNEFIPPHGDFSTLERKTIDGITKVYRTFKDGTVNTYASLSDDTATYRLESIVDRNGNKTQYQYFRDASGAYRISRITDPVGLATVFSYTGKRVTAITDPAGRVTRLSYDTAGNLVSVTDPDGSQRRWSYSSDHLMTGEVDQRGLSESTSYDFAGRAIQSTRKDGSTVDFYTVQRQGLLPNEASINPANPPVAANIGRDAIASYVDGNGNVTTYKLDSEGQSVEARDQLGPIGTHLRNDEHLVTQTLNARGFQTNFTYDDRGNILSIFDEISDTAFAFTTKWISQVDGLWDDPTNWSSGTVPTENDDVLIDVPGRTITVTHSGGNIAIRSLQSNESVVFLGGGLSLASGSRIAGSFSLSAGATLAVDSGRLFAPGITSINEVNLIATGGGKIVLPFVVNYAEPNQGATFLASGPGSLIDLSRLTSFVPTNGRAQIHVLHAVGGGTIDLSQVATIDSGSIQAKSEGLNSLINFASLTRFHSTMHPLDGVNSSFSIPNSGEIRVPQLKSLDQVNLTITPDDQFPTANLERLSRGKLTVIGVTPDLSKLTNIDGANLFASGGGKVILDSVLSYTHTGITAAFEAKDNSSLVDLSHLTSFAPTDGRAQIHVLHAVGGGTIDLSQVATIDSGSIQAKSEGMNSLINFASLTRFHSSVHFLDPIKASISAFDDGLVALHATLIDLALVEIVLSPSGTISGGTIQLNAGASVSGTGTLPGSLENLNGEVRPGKRTDQVHDNDFGFITIQGNYDQGVGAKLSIDIAGVILGQEYGGLNVAGAATFAGTLQLNTLNGFAPGSGETFDILQYGSKTGTFDTITGQDLPNGNHYELVLNAQNAQLVVQGSGAPMAPLFQSSNNPVTTEPGNKLETAQSGQSTPDVSPLSGSGNAQLSGSGSNFATRLFTYDPKFSQLTSYTDDAGGLNHLFLFVIDPANGNTTRMIRVVGEVGGDDDLVTDYTYTPRGLLNTMTDPEGHITDYDYDALGHVTKITYAKGTTDEAFVQYEYDRAGNKTAFIDARRNRTAYQYDSMNRLIKLTEPDPDDSGPLKSPVTLYAYDKAGHMTQMIDSLAHVTNYEFDALGRQTRMIHPDPDSSGPLTSPVEVTKYDRAGNVIEQIDPLGHATQSRYDSRNRMTQSIDADGGVTKFEYDDDNNMTSLTDPVLNTTQFSYDSRNRQTSETDPLGHSILYVYDNANNLTTKTDRNQRVTSYEYDDLNRLTTETWVDGNNVILYGYDKMGNLTTANDALSSLAFTYDKRDRMKTADNDGTPGAPRVVLTYRYDTNGNVTSVSDTIDGQSGAVTSYQYDALNRLIKETQSGNGVSDKRVDFAYNALGQYTSIKRFADLSATLPVAQSFYQYDGMNRLVDLSHKNRSDTIAFYQYTFDEASRITRIMSVDGTVDYGYDNRDELISADYTNPAIPDEFYHYDANGNRTSSHLSTNYETGFANRLMADDTYSYEYDDEGNMIQRTRLSGTDPDGSTVRVFGWDYRNRLTAVIDRTSERTITNQVNNKYDTLNRLITRTANDVTTQFVNDRKDVYFEYNITDNMYTRYVNGSGFDNIMSTSTSPDNAEWQLADQLGTVRTTISDVEEVLTHVVFDSFGRDVFVSGNSTSRIFSGRKYDLSTRTINYRLRTYDPVIGLFISEDLLGLASGLNTHQYVNNDPIRFTDPFGLIPMPPVTPGPTPVISLSPIPGREPPPIISPYPPYTAYFPTPSTTEFPISCTDFCSGLTQVATVFVPGGFIVKCAQSVGIRLLLSFGAGVTTNKLCNRICS